MPCSTSRQDPVHVAARVATWAGHSHVTMATAVHTGGCHCGAVRFEFNAPSKVVAWDCDCSLCSMKRYIRVIVPAEDFKLLKGQDQLTCYQFETKTAKHLFCKVCGVSSFYMPRRLPTGYAIHVPCVEPGTLEVTEVKMYCGKNWEAAYAEHGSGAARATG